MDDARTRSRILLLAGATLCVAVAGAIALLAGRDDAEVPRSRSEATTADTAATQAVGERTDRAPSGSVRAARANAERGVPDGAGPRPQQRQAQRSEGDRVGPSRAGGHLAGEEERPQPHFAGADSSAGIRPDSSGDVERRGLEAHEITLQDVDWFGENVVRLRDSDAPARSETTSGEQGADGRDRAAELAEACAEGDAAACAGRLDASGPTDRVYLPRVVEDSLAFEIGLRAGDEIVRVDGEPIGSVFDVRDALGSRSQGAPILVEALRDGVPMQFSVPAGAALGVPFGSRKSPAPPE